MFLSPVLLWSLLDVTVSETKPHTLPKSHRVSLKLKSQSFGKTQWEKKKKKACKTEWCVQYKPYIQYKWIFIYSYTATHSTWNADYTPLCARVFKRWPPHHRKAFPFNTPDTQLGFWDLSNISWKDMHSVCMFATQNRQVLSTNSNLFLKSFCQWGQQKSPGTGQCLFPTFPVSVSQLNSCFWVNTLKTV